MRKIILGVAVSLDGYIEGPGGEFDWCFTDQDYGLSDFFKKIDAAFMGRKTWELARTMGDSAGLPTNIKIYIFSNTLTEVKENAVLVKGDIRQEVEKLKLAKGKDIWLFGGAALTTSLMNMDLVDELWLSVHPIILGAGKPLFSQIKGRINLNLLESKTYNTGLVYLKYSLQ